MFTKNVAIFRPFTNLYFPCTCGNNFQSECFHNVQIKIDVFQFLNRPPKVLARTSHIQPIFYSELEQANVVQINAFIDIPFGTIPDVRWPKPKKHLTECSTFVFLGRIAPGKYGAFHYAKVTTAKAQIRIFYKEIKKEEILRAP